MIPLSTAMLLAGEMSMIALTAKAGVGKRPMSGRRNYFYTIHWAAFKA
jgi:hypothetical protein